MDVLIHVNSKNEEIQTKINLDELYDRKQIRDLNTLQSYNKILNRIHIRIKNVSKHQINEQFCWYIIPEIILTDNFLTTPRSTRRHFFEA
jgi:hypothetical protein